jgi:hypothetical protein
MGSQAGHFAVAGVKVLHGEEYGCARWRTYTPFWRDVESLRKLRMDGVWHKW